LEDLLVEYQGTMLLVSHDRDFLDNVVTSTLVFEGNGQIGDYNGGYADWVHDKEKRAIAAALRADAEKAKAEQKPVAKSSGRKMTNKERKELDELPAKIEKMEAEQAELTAKLGDPVFYKNQGAQFADVKKRLDALEREHATAFARWEELEALKNS
jgi:ATP-binding cassette subfamily F protein uup